MVLGPPLAFSSTSQERNVVAQVLNSDLEGRIAAGVKIVLDLHLPSSESLENNCLPTNEGSNSQ